MKTDNLMRGDWLYYKGKLNAFPFKVEQVTKKKIGYHTEPNESRMHYLRVCECEPIPLTEEILERSGFKRATDDLYHIPIWKTPYSDGGFYIEKWGKGYGLTDHCYAIVNYVHEFQHLLKLVGINKEIKL